MDPSASSRSGDSTTYTPEAEEIQSLINHGLTGSSFTALLGLPPNQAVDLLHEPGRDEIWREKVTLPANAALVDRAARFSVFAAEEGDRTPAKPKAEVEDYGDRPIWTIEGEGSLRKRKDGGKAKGCCLKKRKGAEEDTGGENKLPYIHVRARRGQATDSHSLAERARREKINARMKLLQNLVPGCSKITSTALALDEIISHVLTLRQLADTLSMRLAVMNHAVNFSSVDHFLSVSEFLRPTAMNERSRMALDQAMMCSEVAANGMQQQVWHVDGVQQQQGPSVCWEKGGDATAHPFLNSSGLSFTYDSAAAVSLPNQLKTEEEL